MNTTTVEIATVNGRVFLVKLAPNEAQRLIDSLSTEDVVTLPSVSSVDTLAMRYDTRSEQRVTLFTRSVATVTVQTVTSGSKGSFK